MVQKTTMVLGVAAMMGFGMSVTQAGSGHHRDASRRGHFVAANPRGLARVIISGVA